MVCLLSHTLGVIADHTEYEPFIVRLADSEAEEFLLTTTDIQIIEKNIQGVIIEILDLSALVSVLQVNRVTHVTYPIYENCNLL